MVCWKFVPICEVIRQWVGDELFGQQEESPEQVNDAATGEKEEGGAERDARLIQQLQEKTRQKISVGIKILLLRVVCECLLP